MNLVPYGLCTSITGEDCSSILSVFVKSVEHSKMINPSEFKLENLFLRFSFSNLSAIRISFISICINSRFFLFFVDSNFSFNIIILSVFFETDLERDILTVLDSLLRYTLSSSTIGTAFMSPTIRILMRS